MSRKISILGIHTDIGKTVAAAVMTEALQADYWKPVQAGDLDNSDTKKIKKWISNNRSVVHNEAIRLQMAASPHIAAANENLVYSFKDFKMPQNENLLLIETAGGVYSPIDKEHTMLDMVEYYGWETVLVSNNYLGSINHTLLCLEAIKKRNIDILALIINGARNESSEQFIRKYAKIDKIVYIPSLSEICQKSIADAAASFRKQWDEYQL